jgi:hypothetical protein
LFECTPAMGKILTSVIWPQHISYPFYWCIALKHMHVFLFSYGEHRWQVLHFSSFSSCFFTVSLNGTSRLLEMHTHTSLGILGFYMLFMRCAVTIWPTTSWSLIFKSVNVLGKIDEEHMNWPPQYPVGGRKQPSDTSCFSFLWSIWHTYVSGCLHHPLSCCTSLSF